VGIPTFCLDLFEVSHIPGIGVFTNKTSQSGLDLTSIDYSVRPQHNFYQFCNGNWKEKIPRSNTCLDVVETLKNITLHKLRNLIIKVISEGVTDVSTNSGKQIKVIKKKKKE
jgi:predicted metalloendopeptidase